MLHAPCSIMASKTPSLDYTPQSRSGQCTPPAVERRALDVTADAMFRTSAQVQLWLLALGARFGCRKVYGAGGAGNSAARFWHYQCGRRGDECDGERWNTIAGLLEAKANPCAGDNRLWWRWWRLAAVMMLTGFATQMQISQRIFPGGPAGAKGALHAN
jgi:hypothetical protein